MTFLSKYFTRNGKEKPFSNDSSFISNLINTKRILPSQSKLNMFLQTYLIAPSNIPHFSPKKKSVIILKMTNFWRKCLAIFHNVKKIEIYFPCNTFVHLFLMFVNIGFFFLFFFWMICRDGIKNIFHNILRIFRMAILKYSNSNF